MSKYTLEDFVNQSCQQDRGEGVFELETPRMLELNLDGSIWTKMGTMVSYRGDVRFTREGIMDRGVGNLLKKAVSGEGARLTKAEGKGQVYLADAGKKLRSYVCRESRSLSTEATCWRSSLRSSSISKC